MPGAPSPIGGYTIVEICFGQVHNGLFVILIFFMTRDYLKTMKRLRDKARLCFDHVVPTPLELRILRLPSSVSLIYYLLRPAGLAGMHGQKLMKRFFSGSDITDDKKET